MNWIYILMATGKLRVAAWTLGTSGPICTWPAVDDLAAITQGRLHLWPGRRSIDHRRFLDGGHLTKTAPCASSTSPQNA